MHKQRKPHFHMPDMFRFRRITNSDNSNSYRSVIWQRFVKQARSFTYYSNNNVRLNYFIDDGCLHGVRYLGNRCTWLGKIFWSIILLGSLIGMIIIFQLTMEDFQEDSITITPDTAYLHWDNIFPSVSVCIRPLKTQWGSPKEIAMIKFINKYYKENNLSLDTLSQLFYDQAIDYVFISPIDHFYFDNEDCYMLNLNDTCGLDVSVIEQFFIPKSCKQFMHNLTYLNKIYDNCEDIFKLQKNEMGTCFVANSIEHYDLDMAKLPLKYNRTDKDLVLQFNLENSDEYKIYVQSPEERPSILSKYAYNEFSYNFKYEFAFTTNEIINDNMVHNESIERRQCRFPDERLDEMYMPYSYSACLTWLRIKIELENCNCTIHTSPINYKKKYCNYKQLQCIRDADIVTKTIDRALNDEQECLHSCLEMTINSIGKFVYPQPWSELDRESTDQDYMSTFVIRIQIPPYHRIIRTVAMSKLDLVVSIGGTVGLFFGASILGVIEIIYIWLIRKF